MFTACSYRKSFFCRWNRIASASLVLFLLVYHNSVWGRQITAQADDAQFNQPHTAREGLNRVENPSIEGLQHWQTTGTATFDSTESRTFGSGSIRLSTVRDRIVSGLIPVVPEEVYTIAFYWKSNQWPTPIPVLFISGFDSDGRFLSNRNGSRQGLSDSTQWQESVLFFKARPGDAFIKINILLETIPTNTQGSIWLDDFYVGEGLGFEQPPAPRKPFEGSRVRVDELGNMEIASDRAWKPFFPLAIYSDNYRPDWSFYSRQGFNTIMWAGAYPHIQQARDAVSSFNPNGMMAGLNLSSYIGPDNNNYNNLRLLETRLEEIQINNLMDQVLLYYWDNEHTGEWEVPKAVVQSVRAYDIDENGQYQHPIYVLQGEEGIARAYNNANVQISDIVGTYSDTIDQSFGPGGTSKDFLILSNLQNQQNPVVFIQLNQGIGATLRPRLFSAINNGAKGMGFWRDFYNDPGWPRIEEQPWWDDFPNIRREIDLMIPLIREPHWTTWRVRSSSEALDLGTRDLGKWGYIIAANMSAEPVVATLTVEGLPYQANEVIDYFSGTRTTYIQGQSFQVALPAYGTGVYRLIASEQQNPLPAFEANLAHFNLSETELNHDRPLDQPYSSAGGSIHALLKDNTISITGTFHELSGDFSAMHLHEAAPGHEGPIRAFLNPQLGASGQNGLVSEEMVLSDTLVQALHSGMLYLDIHSHLLRDGEVRGQLLLLPNHAPPPAEVVTPLSDQIDTADADSSSRTLSWLPVTDRDNNEVMYQLEFALNSRFDQSVLHQVQPTEHAGSVSYTLSVLELALLLKRLSVEKDKTIQLHYRVNTTDGSLRAVGASYSVIIIYSGPGSVDTEPEEPTQFKILGLYPNPAHQTATLLFDLPQPANVQVWIYDMQGRTVSSVPGLTIPAGVSRSVILNVAPLSSGAYVYRFMAQTATRSHISTGRFIVMN